MSGSSVVSRQLPQKQSLPPAQQIAVDFSKRECSATDGATVDSDDRDSVSAPKRSYPMAWDHDSRIGKSNFYFRISQLDTVSENEYHTHSNKHY